MMAGLDDHVVEYSSVAGAVGPGRAAKGPGALQA